MDTGSCWQQVTYSNEGKDLKGLSYTAGVSLCQLNHPPIQQDCSGKDSPNGPLTDWSGTRVSAFLGH